MIDGKTGARSETDIQWGYSAGGEFSADTSLNPSEIITKVCLLNLFCFMVLEKHLYQHQ